MRIEPIEHPGVFVSGSLKQSFVVIQTMEASCQQIPFVSAYPMGAEFAHEVARLTAKRTGLPYVEEVG